MSDTTKAADDVTEAADEPKAEATPAKPPKTRVRRVHRLGVAMPLKELTVPEGGLTSIPVDWDFHSHKELKADDFADVLLYFQWYLAYGQKIVELAQAKSKELEAYGDADTRREVSDLFGNTESVAMAAVAALKKEGLNEEQKAALKARMAEILGAAFD